MKLCNVTFSVFLVMVAVCCYMGCGNKGDAAKNLEQQVKMQQEAEEAAKVVQQSCPVEGNPISEDLYVDYEGKRIFVCCSTCVDIVKSDPVKYLKKLEAMKEIPHTIQQ